MKKEPLVGKEFEYKLAFTTTLPHQSKVKRHPLAERFHQILAEIGALHDRKQQDYGLSNDPFANVRGSVDWGLPAWVGAMVRASDKLRRLQKFATTGKLANESVIDSFRDLAVYAIIAEVLFEEEVNGRDKAATEAVRHG